MRDYVPAKVPALVALALVAVIVAGCGDTRSLNRASGFPASMPTTQSQVRHAASTSYSYDVLAYLFPRNGADVSVGAQLTSFDLAVMQKSEAHCLAADGFPGPPVYPSPLQAYGNADFPNMPVIESRRSLGVTDAVSARVDPTRGMSVAETQAYNAAQMRCQRRAQRPFAFLGTGAAHALMTQWMNIYFRVEASPSVVSVNRTATACAAHSPFAADSVPNEVQAIEGRLTPLLISGRVAQAKMLQAQGVRVLAKCFGPEEELIGRLMAGQRDAFLAQNAQAISQIESATNRVVQVEAASYGVRAPRPGGSQ